MTGAALTLEICAGPLLSRPVRYGCAGLSFICSMTGCAMSEQSSGPTSNRKADPAPTPQDPTGAGTLPAEKKGAGRRKLLLGAAGLLILAGALWFGIPWVQTTLNTVSTDDAYVNGHVTFVAARVKGQVSRVLVDDNYRVRKGDLLVQLDKEPFQIAVAIKKAAVDTATADLQVAKSKVRGIEAEAMSRRRALEHAMEDVDDQVALLRAKVAGVDKSKAELALAQVDFDRAAKLVVTNDTPRSEYDRRQADLVVGARGRCRGAGRCPSNPRLFGIAAGNPTKQISARFRPISIKPFLPCSRRRRR